MTRSIFSVLMVTLLMVTAAPGDDLGSSSQALDSHWSKNEPFGHNIPRDLKTDGLEDVRDQLAVAGITVERGRTDVIIPQKDIGADRGFVGSLVKFPNGDIQVKAGKTQLRSSDAGRTWRPVESQFQLYPCRTDDGVTLQFTGRTTDGRPPHKLHPSERPGLVQRSAELIRSPDSGLTETAESATIFMPMQCKMLVMNHGRIVELPDGSLLSNGYATFEEDPIVTYDTWVMKIGRIHAYKFQKNRVVVIHSADGGQTWHYRATVAFDASRHTRKRIVGFAEPDMVALSSGELLCFMRTVAGGGIRPLHMSTSRDGGMTWSHADPVADRGVSPCVIEMSSGLIVLGYGRPMNWLAFSTDGGQTWLGHFQFYMGAKGWDSWNQLAFEEVAPDTLLVTYARLDPTATIGTKERRRGDLMGTYFTVKWENQQ